jgi:O-antigen/teichoic acid export membrane protein
MIDRLYLGIVVKKLPLTTSYHFGVKIPQFIAGMVDTPGTTVFSSASYFDSAKDHKRLEELHTRAGKFFTAAGIFLFGFIFVFIDEILLLWLNRPLLEAAIVCRIIIIARIIGMTTRASTAVAAGIGRPDIEVRATFINLVLFLASFFLLFRKFEHVGLAVAWTIGQIIAVIYFLSVFWKLVNFNKMKFAVWAIIKPIFLFLPLIFTYFMMKIGQQILGFEQTRFHAFMFLSVIFVIYSGLSLFALLKINFFTSDEINFIKQKLAKYLPVGKHA